MIGRSLFSLLVVAAAALQSCVATAIEDGNYVISSSERVLVTDSGDQGYVAYVSYYEDQQVWRVKNQVSDYVVIQSTKSDLFLPPDDAADDYSPTILSSEKFIWRLFKETDGTVYIEQPRRSSGDSPLVLGTIYIL